MGDRNTSLQERVLIALPWASIPLLAAHVSFLWSELPQRIAVHFDLQGRPNGWQSPAIFAAVAFGALAFDLVLMTVLTLRAFRLRSLWRAMVIIANLLVWGSFVLFWHIFDYAVDGRDWSQLWPMPAGWALAAFAIAGIMLARIPSSQAAKQPGALLIAEEQHRSLVQLLFVLPGIGIGAWLAIRAATGPRIVGIFLAAVMAWVALAVLEGFRYQVRTDGVEIKGFLLPLRFIPRSSIRSYRTAAWRGLGYGIRLTGTGTAYIWGGRKVVNIATDSGDVMLGHCQPERLIQDLDRMMQTPPTH